MIKFGSDSVVLRFQKNLPSYNMKSEEKKAVLDEKENLIDLNRSQLRIGIDSLGTTFGDYKSSDYTKYKMGLPSYRAKPPTPDLYDEGTLQNEMDLRFKGKKVDVYSKDPQAKEKLSGRFGNAFGFNDNILPISEQIVTDTFFNNTHNILFK